MIEKKKLIEQNININNPSHVEPVINDVTRTSLPVLERLRPTTIRQVSNTVKRGRESYWELIISCCFSSISLGSSKRYQI